MNMKKYSGKILHNLYIPDASGAINQIDLVYISSRGIFVIESKNYSGTIQGNETSNNWITEYMNNSSNSKMIKRNSSIL